MPHSPESSTSHVARSAALVAALFAGDKVLGLARDVVIGRTFGASAQLDAYYAAFELPDGLFTIIAGSAMATTLIPILSTRISRGQPEQAWRLVSAIVNLALAIVTGIGAVAALFAPQVIQTVAPGFDPKQVALGAKLMRLVLLQTLLFTASGILVGVLRAFQHFLLPALAPVFYTIGRIAGTLWLAPYWGIFGLAWGGVAGAVVYFVILVPGLVRYRARWWPTFVHPDLRALLRLMGPRVLGLGATYLNFVLPTFFGSRLSAGAISAYEYGWRLMQFPETIIGTALGITVFPTLADLANLGDRPGLRRTASWALRLVLALAVPAAVGLLVLGRPLTVLLFQRGAFDPATTDRVHSALQFFTLGLIVHGALEVVSRLFYAQQDMWTPLWAALAGLVANAVLGWLLLPTLAQGALALSNSLGVGLQVGILFLIARRRLKGIEEGALVASLSRTAAASVLMGATLVGFRRLWPGLGSRLVGLAGLAVGTTTYLLTAALLGSEEVRQLPRLLLRRGDGLGASSA
ncbi:MAG: murein biosynthesis integral membrane protein MurJ [Anaerolineae bacterium]|jgi:putative peptidoglycan lipid II flippase